MCRRVAGAQTLGGARSEGLRVRLVENPAVARPAEDVEIWRYMDVAKFLDLVLHDRLFFCNGKALSDEHEGAVPDTILEAKRRDLQNTGLSGRDLEEEMAAYQYLEANAMCELALFNCWSIGTEESYALWKVYLGGQPFGVAIKSTVGQLLASIGAGGDDYPEDFYVGTVEYREDLPERPLHRLNLLTRKMPFYRYENELRLIILNYPRSEGGTKTPYSLSIGRHVQVDTSVLVQSIVVSPFSPNHFYSSMESVVEAIAPSLRRRMAASQIRDS
jgi:hypothetical protein